MKTSDTTTPLRAAIYIRVSTEEQANEGYSIDAQKEKLTALCKSQDWQVYEIYADEGFSAKDLNRPGIQRLLQDAERRKFDIIVFYKLDRLSRSLKDLTSLIDKFEKLSIKIKSLTEPFDTTSPPGKLMLNMLGSFAQFEREIIGERTKLGLERAFRQGKWVTSAPFGYKVKNGKLQVDEEEANTVRKIFELFLEKNYGIKTIVNFLNRNYKLNGRKKTWAMNSVWKILKNPVYCGYVRWKGEVKKGNHKPLISKDTFDRVQKILESRNKIPPRTATTSSLLVGLVKCGICGSRLTPARGKSYKYYACIGRDNGCKLPYISAPQLEEAIVKEIEKISTDKKVIDDSLKKLKERMSKETERMKKEHKRLNRGVERLEKQKEKKLEWLSETLPSRNITQKISREIEEIDQKIREAKIKLSQTEVDLKEKEIKNIKSEMVGAFLKNFRYYFEVWDTRRKRLLLESVVKKITVYSKERAKVVFAIPISLLNGGGQSENVAGRSVVTVFIPKGVGEGI